MKKIVWLLFLNAHLSSIGYHEQLTRRDKIEKYGFLAFIPATLITLNGVKGLIKCSDKKNKLAIQQLNAINYYDTMQMPQLSKIELYQRIVKMKEEEQKLCSIINSNKIIIAFGCLGMIYSIASIISHDAGLNQQNSKRKF